MKYIIRTTVIFILLMLPVQAWAEFTGLDLLRGCAAVIKQLDGRPTTPKENTEMTYWTGFLAGFIDGNIITRL